MRHVETFNSFTLNEEEGPYKRVRHLEFEEKEKKIFVKVSISDDGSVTEVTARDVRKIPFKLGHRVRPETVIDWFSKNGYSLRNDNTTKVMLRGNDLVKWQIKRGGRPF